MYPKLKLVHPSYEQIKFSERRLLRVHQVCTYFLHLLFTWEIVIIGRESKYLGTFYVAVVNYSSIKTTLVTKHRFFCKSETGTYWCVIKQVWQQSMGLTRFPVQINSSH